MKASQKHRKENPYTRMRARARFAAALRAGLWGFFWIFAASWAFGAGSKSPGSGAGLDALAQKLADKNDFVRRGAVGELIELRDPRAIRLLVGALNDKSPMVRSQAAEGLGNLKAKESARDLARLLENDPNVQVRQSSALALSFIADAAPALIACLKSPEAALVQTCVGALGGLKAAEAVGPLSALLTSPDASLRIAVLGALGRIKTPPAGQAVRNLLAPPPAGEKKAPLDPSVERAAIIALGSFGDAQDAAWVKPGLRSPDDRVKSAACGTLAQTGDKTPLATCTGLLSHADLSIRREIAQALGAIGDAQTLTIIDTAQKTEKDPIVLQNLRISMERIRQSLNQKGAKPQ